MRTRISRVSHMYVVVSRMDFTDSKFAIAMPEIRCMQYLKPVPVRVLLTCELRTSVCQAVPKFSILKFHNAICHFKAGSDHRTGGRGRESKRGSKQPTRARKTQNGKRKRPGQMLRIPTVYVYILQRVRERKNEVLC